MLPDNLSIQHGLQLSCSSFLHSWVWVLIYWGLLFARLLIFFLKLTHSPFWCMTCKQWCYMLVHVGGLCTWLRVSCWLYILTNRAICWTVLACAGSRRECLRDSSSIVNEHEGVGKGNWGPRGACVVKSSLWVNWNLIFEDLFLLTQVVEVKDPGIFY